MIASLDKFNSLTQKQAQAMLAKAEGQKADFRSCMYCNGAHNHLRDRVLKCFACGYWYLWGYPGPVVAKRARGEGVTEQEFGDFQATIDEA